MRPFPAEDGRPHGLTKQETGPRTTTSRRTISIHELLQIQQLRAVKQRHHIDKLKVVWSSVSFEEVIVDQARSMRVAPELDHDTDFEETRPEIHNAVDLFQAPEGRDLLISSALFTM